MHTKAPDYFTKYMKAYWIVFMVQKLDIFISKDVQWDIGNCFAFFRSRGGTIPEQVESKPIAVFAVSIASNLLRNGTKL